MEPVDIRERTWVSHADILGLNFIRRNPHVRFRQHHRQGLRSVILEVLDPEDLDRESAGVVIDGVRRFPAAVPRKMFRIFRTAFPGIAAALSEIRRIQGGLAYLTARHMAVSQEIPVSYRIGDRFITVLCGLQDFIVGEPLDVWGGLPEVRPAVVFDFVQRIKRMAHEARLIPDLAGIGNLILTPAGELVLVDINNISSIHMDDTIRLDDKGYPVCDKSVEALSILESRLLHRPMDPTEALYAHFLSADRRAAVAGIIRRIGSMSVVESFK